MLNYRRATNRKQHIPASGLHLSTTLIISIPSSFQIDAESGKISTAVVLDRDEICPQQLTCVLRLDVAVQPLSHFEVIKIDIDLLDLNDNSPVFGQSVLNYRVSESTGFPKELFPIIPASDA